VKEALFYNKQPDGSAVCGLCPHGCRIAQSRAGLCGARKNAGGTLIAESYGRVSSLNLDPIEKKPFKKFFPGSMILSVGGYGCSMKCAYCQNHSISQAKPETEYIQPEKLLQIAKNTAGNIGIAFTYNEPLVGMEYILDAAPLFKDAGLKVALVTNGMVNPEPLKVLLPYVDAMNIDVKAFTTEGYKKLGGDLPAVMQTVETCASACHVEITTLIVPGLNDGADEMRALSVWLSEISPEVPLHISRFFPRYKKAGASSTPVGTMKLLADIARKNLKYVYLGNV